jgi:anti-anti-sigma factor
MMTTQDFQATVRERDGVAVIDLVGDVDSTADAPLSAAYALATRAPVPSVILNFAGVAYIDSSGIAVIVEVLTKARGDGLHVRAFGLTDHYREIFEITRLAEFMTIADSEDAAVTAHA